MDTRSRQFPVQVFGRAEKGNNLMCFPDTYVVIDVETTGLSPKYGDIIEFGAFRVVDGVVISTFSSLVNPGYSLKPKITEITGITDDILAPAPRMRDALPEFISFTSDKIVVGHNVTFDIGFINEACLDVLSIPFNNNYVDTMRLSRCLFPQERHHRLSDLVERFGIQAHTFHRALADVELTDRCFRHMKNYVQQNNIDISALAAERPSPAAPDAELLTAKCTPGHTVRGKMFVFTGNMVRLTREEAIQLVETRGGFCTNTVSKFTDYLVVGTNTIRTDRVGHKSKKRIKAEQLKLSGHQIQIITETVFYRMIG